MISRSTSMYSKNNNAPFLLRPAGQDYLWGGNRLNEDFSKNMNMTPLAETWECSVHPDGESTVASGIYDGQRLSAVLLQHPEYMGTHPGSTLPILIKLIDAKKDLSVQVHPADDYALLFEGQLGKTEMWYVIEATKDAKLVYGFSRDVSKIEIERAVKEHRIEKYLQFVPIKKDDVFYVPSGTVHAICAGALVAEVQQNSNVTYRLFDYDRTDRTGEKRELHVNKALDVTNFSASPEPRQPLRVKKFGRGYALELLCRCKYFQVERMLLNTARVKKMAELQTGANSFMVLFCTDGCGTICWENGGILNFFRGDCIFIPANSVELKLHGQAQLLRVGC